MNLIKCIVQILCYYNEFLTVLNFQHQFIPYGNRTWITSIGSSIDWALLYRALCRLKYSKHYVLLCRRASTAASPRRRARGRTARSTPRPPAYAPTPASTGSPASPRPRPASRRPSPTRPRHANSSRYTTTVLPIESIRHHTEVIANRLQIIRSSTSNFPWLASTCLHDWILQVVGKIIIMYSYINTSWLDVFY